MAYTATTPREFLLKANLTPLDGTLPVSQAALDCLRQEIQRLHAHADRLQLAYDAIVNRMKNRTA